MLNNRIMHLDMRSKSYKFYDSVVYLDTLQHEPLVNCRCEKWTIDNFEKEIYNLPDCCPLTFKEGKCSNNGVAIFVYNTTTFDREQKKFTLNIVGDKCVSQNQETFLVFCFHNTP